MTISRQAETVFDASLFEDCKHALLRLQGVIHKRQWDKLPKVEALVAQNMKALQDQSQAVQSAFSAERLQLFQQLSRLQRSIMRDLSIQMNANMEDQSSLEEGMKYIQHLSSVSK